MQKLNWDLHGHDLNENGFTCLPPLVSVEECRDLAQGYDDPDRYRKTVTMKQHNFGRGEYRYFSYPLPGLVDELRHALFPPLARIANDWHEKLNIVQRYPDHLDEWLAVCHQAGQTRPTPLILNYQTGDWNALHQDIYGELYFPFQAVLFLTQPGRDYAGGEFVMLEQRPRRQSKAIVLQPEQGQVLVFTTRHRPAKGTRGYYRVSMRHGVSEVRQGTRLNLGIIFHDAQ
ncbi:prolyl 4-hydroxylase subunit alpha [Fibrisoma montanum]|uniref:Prolyl 4-hydroxylase subunit alpha n=1 Tax=Fibrisoma montanum TaxID=2305895 RepID=A0A418LXG6_9BACT|nr:2OG-Fe(II) oxygenase [Fibrisoma montanum]RIV18006.1 prolyl 4-hydroxylase subunit alpha [Fibrisoma montanum]